MRRSDMAAVGIAAATSPALRGADPALTGLWTRLAHLLVQHDIATLRFGTAVPAGRELALTLSIEPDRLDPLMDELVRRAMVVREADQALTVPLLAELAARRSAFAARRDALRQQMADQGQGGAAPPTPRVLANRINGALGGRPRKHEAAGPAVPGQASWPFAAVVAGADHQPAGAPSVSPENPNQNPMGSGVGSEVGSASLAASRGLSVCLSEESLNSTDRQTDLAQTQTETHAESQTELAELERIGREVLSIARLPPESWGANSSALVESWFRMGFSGDDVVAIARRAMSQQGAEPRTLAWFTPLLRAADRARRHPAPASSPRGKAQEALVVAPGLEDAPQAAVWRAVREQLRREVGEADFQAWIRGLTLAAIDGAAVVLEAPTTHARDWVNEKFGFRIKRAWRKRGMSDVELRVPKREDVLLERAAG